MSHAIHKIVSIKRCQSYFISRRSPHLGISKDSELCASAHRCLHYAYARLIARVTFYLPIKFHQRIQLCGHIHQELDLDWNGRRLMATPSTCVQFKPHCAGFTLDTVAPGWRWLNLHPDGSLTTEVCRLEGAQFRPDTASEGY